MRHNFPFCKIHKMMLKLGSDYVSKSLIFFNLIFWDYYIYKGSVFMAVHMQLFDWSLSDI